MSLNDLTHQDDPEKLLQLASKAAQEMLVRLEKQVEDQKRQLQETMRMIDSLKIVAAIGQQHKEMISPERLIQGLRRRLVIDSSEPPEQQVLPPLEDKQIILDIDHVFLSSEPLKVKDLQAKIHEQFGRQWGESTLYSYLARGKKVGRYSNENNFWSLTDAARENIL